MSTIDRNLIVTAVHRLIDAVHPQRVYLFGSTAQGTASMGSDVDLLLVIPHSQGRETELDLLARRAIGDIGCGIDLVIRTPEAFDQRSKWRSNIEHTVLESGQLLHG